MNRRTFLLKSSAATLSALGVTSMWPRFASIARAEPKEFNPQPGAWRTFEITTRVELLQPKGITRVWLPMPVVNTEYQRTLGDTWAWSGNVKVVEPVSEATYGPGMLYAEFADGDAAPVVQLASRFRAQSRSLDWSRTVIATEEPATLPRWTEPTELMPTDGVVLTTAEDITRGKTSDLDKVRAVYDWILANTYREPGVRGCGVGDIKSMLETRNFGGKCGDINALFVGLVRSVGVPARDIYRDPRGAVGVRLQGAGAPAARTSARHSIVAPRSS